MMVQDTKNTYSIHLMHKHLPNVTGRGHWQDPSWHYFVKQKVIHAMNVVKYLNDGDFVLYSDMDVVPLDFYSKVPVPQSISFSMEGKSGCNTGFYALTVSNKTRNFLSQWNHKIQKSRNRPFGDQSVLSESNMCRDSFNASRYAFHANGQKNKEAALERMKLLSKIRFDSRGPLLPKTW